MSQAPAKLISPEEFERMPESADHELVRGALLSTNMPTNPEHGRIVARLVRRIDEHVESCDLGEVYIDVGFWLPTDPPSVRSPDVSFVTKDRLPDEPQVRGFYRFVPDMAVEVVSPEDSASELEEKISDYLDSGVAVVGVVFPETRKVRTSAQGRLQSEFGPDEAIEAAPILPGLHVKPRDFFGTHRES